MLPIDVWAWDDKYKKNLSQNIVDRYVRRCIACLVSFKVKRYSAALPLETDNKEVNLSNFKIEQYKGLNWDVRIHMHAERNKDTSLNQLGY